MARGSDAVNRTWPNATLKVEAGGNGGRPAFECMASAVPSKL